MPNTDSIREKQQEDIVEKSNNSNMQNSSLEEKKIGGNIALIGFSILQPIELVVIKKITGNYVKKISEIADYKELKLRLKQHKHGKSFLNELECETIITTKGTNKDIILAAKSEQYNIYSALADVLSKVYAEALHHKRLSKEIGAERARHEIEEETKESKALGESIPI
jgi:hypothetical protein